MAIATAAVMAGAWAWAEWIWLSSGQSHSWLTPGAVVWVASSGVMLTGCGRLRLDQGGVTAGGFEVIPIARIAANPEPEDLP